MKKAFVLCAIVGAAVYAATALSASGPTPIEKTLQKQVKTLTKTVATLKKNQSADEAVIGVTLLFTVCSDEIAADALQGTWSVVDQISSALQAGKTYFGPQTPVTATIQGQDVCASGGVTRSPVTSGAVPTIAGYQALLGGLSAYKLQTLLRNARLHH
jgi:hypothetical protein